MVGEEETVIRATKETVAKAIEYTPRLSVLRGCALSGQEELMLKQVLKFRIVLVTLLMLTLFCPGAFARGDDRGGDRGNNRIDYRGYNRGDRYYYRDGGWYKPGWFGFGVLVSALAIGALIDALPPQHTTVVVQGTPYYYGDNHYYRQASNGGYVVVAPPVLVQPTVQTQEMVTINIPNSRGGYTPVLLRRAGYGYLGPQGEYYSESPTVNQLRALYGN